MATSSEPLVWRGTTAAERVAPRRRRLVQAAYELLGEHGARGTTVRGVCARAGLNPRYFYESFEDLDALLVAVFDRIASEALEAVLAAVEAAPLEEMARARAAVGAMVELMTDDPRKGRIAFIEAMGSEALMRRRLDTLHTCAVAASEQARSFYDPGTFDMQDADLSAHVLAGGITEAMIAWFDDRLDVTRERLIEHCAALFVAAAGVSTR